jgi:hypothetical protein
MMENYMSAANFRAGIEDYDENLCEQSRPAVSIETGRQLAGSAVLASYLRASDFRCGLL